MLKKHRISRRRTNRQPRDQKAVIESRVQLPPADQEFRQLFTVIIILGCYCDRQLPTVWIPRRYQHRYPHNRHSIVIEESVAIDQHRTLRAPTSLELLPNRNYQVDGTHLIRFRLRDSGSVHADPTVLRGTLLVGSGWNSLSRHCSFLALCARESVTVQFSGDY